MAVAYMGLSPCRMCGNLNRAAEYADNLYQWPEGLAHYVYDHAVRLPQEFVDHAIGRLEELATAHVSLDWWLDTTTWGHHQPIAPLCTAVTSRVTRAWPGEASASAWAPQAAWLRESHRSGNRAQQRQHHRVRPWANNR